MIRHIVLFNLKPEIDSADRDRLFAQMKGLAKLPIVRNLSVGKLLEAREDWYRSRVNTDYAWAMSMEFDNEDALYAYQRDPAHVTVADEIRKRVSGFRVLDFVSVT